VTGGCRKFHSENFFLESLKGRDHSVDLCEDERVILKWV
jgi:hypothetical protein